MIAFNPCSSGPDRSVVSQSTGNSRWTLRVARVQYNSQILMQQDPVAAERFLKLMTDTDKIVLHEDYAGVGTCGVTMVQQFNSFKASLATKLPPGDPLASQEQLKIFRVFNFYSISNGFQVTSHLDIKRRPEVNLSVFRLSLQLAFDMDRHCRKALPTRPQAPRNRNYVWTLFIFTSLVWCTIHIGQCSAD